MLDIIKRRRSIRKYMPEQIKDAELAAILEAAAYAPSGHNSQPWHFTVVQNKELIDSISNNAKQVMITSPLEKAQRLGSSENYHLLHNAPTVIIVSGDTEAKSPLELPHHAFGSYTPLADCAAAIENMLLAAESIGLGSCWVGLVNYFFILGDEVAKLGIPAQYQPLFAVCLGYKDPALVGAVAAKRKADCVNYIR
ncbi:MAG: nitroreductase [Anaerosporomusa subterranea]|jgi:nitroreductase|nr:nitroreductase [Anaerosporomusa subterranea]